MTLLPPLKQIISLKLPKLSISNPQPDPPISSDLVPLPPTPSEILEGIGAQLRQLRQQQKLSIEDISARTQIQPRLVQAIEEGHIEMLPESVYVKGMVKRYGDSLGLDGIALSQQVPNWKREDADFTQQTLTQTTGFTGFKTRQVNPLYLYLGYGLVVFGIGAGFSHLLNGPSTPKRGIDRATVVSKTAASMSTQIPTVAVAAKTAALPNVKIEITVTAPTWAQIGTDGTTRFTGNLQAGAKLDLIATKQVTINTNNAGGLLVAQDLKSPQPVGKLGQKQHVTIKVGK